jgi:hypothetical protein
MRERVSLSGTSPLFTFEGQFGEAKSSMVADAISQNSYLDYHGSGNAYSRIRIFDFEKK